MTDTSACNCRESIIFDVHDRSVIEGQAFTLDFLLMLPVKMPVADTFHTQNNKATGKSNVDDSPCHVFQERTVDRGKKLRRDCQSTE